MSLANYLTFLRILIVPVFFTELLSYGPGHENHRWIAFGLFLLASLTDAADGFLARVTGSKTELGKFLDPLADKLLLLSGYLGLLFVSSLTYHPPLWITVTIVFRDMVILMGLFVLFWLNGTIEIRPNLLGKATTAFQMITLLAVLLQWEFSFILWNTTAVLTIASFFVYIARELSKMRTRA